jgi:hypothetical protein
MLEVMKAAVEGVPLDLSSDLRNHAEKCPHCASTLPAWIAGNAGMKRFAEETDLMKRGALGDPSVVRRRVKEGTAFFLPAETGSGLGLMVIVGDRSPFDARRASRVTRAEFDDWE